MSVEDDERYLAERAACLLHEAQGLCFVLTISAIPLKPLAMGHHSFDIEIRPIRAKQQIRKTGKKTADIA